MDFGVHYLSFSGKEKADMERSLAELEAIVRNRICKVCTERTVERRVRPGGTLQLRPVPPLPASGPGHPIRPQRRYPPVHRGHPAQVCSVCVDQAADGSCETRQQVQCALDAYLLLVVDAIEEATGKTFDKTSLRPTGAPIEMRPNPQMQF